MQQKGSHLREPPIKNAVPKNGLTAMIAAPDQNGSLSRHLKGTDFGKTIKIHLTEDDKLSLVTNTKKEIHVPLENNLKNDAVRILQSSPKSEKSHTFIRKYFSVEVYRNVNAIMAVIMYKEF